MGFFTSRSLFDRYDDIFLGTSPFLPQILEQEAAQAYFWNTLSSLPEARKANDEAKNIFPIFQRCVPIWKDLYGDSMSAVAELYALYKDEANIHLVPSGIIPTAQRLEPPRTDFWETFRQWLRHYRLEKDWCAEFLLEVLWSWQEVGTPSSLELPYSYGQKSEGQVHAAAVEFGFPVKLEVTLPPWFPGLTSWRDWEKEAEQQVLNDFRKAAQSYRLRQQEELKSWPPKPPKANHREKLLQAMERIDKLVPNPRSAEERIETANSILRAEEERARLWAWLEPPRQGRGRRPSLKPEAFTWFALHHCLGWSTAKLARRFKVSEPTLHRAFQRLRKRLELDTPSYR